VLELSILYRGPLESCNYACPYCPFAKRREGRSELANDEAALARFVDWAASRQQDRLSILFTPWGEALVRPWYQDALATLSHLPQVAKVAAQTNLAGNLDWIGRCETKRLALWCSYHPEQITRDRFLAQCNRLDVLGIRYSVGMVGLKEYFDEAEALRRVLPSGVYLWINAYDDRTDYYSGEDLRRIEAIDPLFPFSTKHHPSMGHDCRAGESVISVDGAGTIRRCHFITEPLGNLYEPGFESVLKQRTCTNANCVCHIGYVHLVRLGLDRIFGDGALERIPKTGEDQVSTSG